MMEQNHFALPTLIRISVQLTFRTFLKQMFYVTYRRVLILFITLLGIVFLLDGIFAAFGIVLFVVFTPFFTILYGIFMVFFVPMMTFVRAQKYFNSSKRLQELRNFEFSLEKINVQSESANLEYRWTTVYEVKESGNWILIFLSRVEAIFIPKTAFSPDQLVDFKKMVNNVPKLKKRWNR